MMYMSLAGLSFAPIVLKYSFKTDSLLMRAMGYRQWADGFLRMAIDQYI